MANSINASAISNQVESHLSLASIHVDFSLIKVQPPTEYHELGKALSIQRNDEAENGQSHATASKLGALFDGLVPPAEHLIRAYGLRCSEIAKSPTFNPKGTQKHGLFADQVGADGTTIWAAATSGDSAIAVHLLACMLAQIWEGPEAISIWMELISVRKQTLAASRKPLDFPASRISLTREQIANWDASARAWCLTADQANQLRQKQLLLIIDHLGIPVSGKRNLSESVIESWQSAMTTVNRLIAGEPQSVEIGAPLLGLASWHLYPDMVVFGKDKEVKDVKQKDTLVHRGGILTLGIEDARRRDVGIYWSLPLAHLRYYGDPVQTEGCLHSQTSRVSMDQLLHVALGSLIRRWCAEANDIEPAAELLVNLNNYLGFPLDTRTPTAWLPLLAMAARTFLTSQGHRKSEILQLIKCGRRKYPTFIDNLTMNSIFGLSECKTFLRMLPGNQARVSFLREVAKDFSDNRFLLVIQCKAGPVESQWELASVEQLRSTSKRTRDPRWFRRRYIRWLNMKHEDLYEEDKHADSDSIRLDTHIPQFSDSQEFQWRSVPKSFYHKFLEESCSDLGWESARGASVGSRFLIGDPTIAAVYAVSVTYWKISPNEDALTVENKQIRGLPNIFVLRHVSWALERRLIHYQALYKWMSGAAFSARAHSMLSSLKGLLTIWNLYQNLPDATVELKVASKPLCSHQWIPEGDHCSDISGPFHLTQEQTFACIARFESGGYNFQPSVMNDVLAISIGNSLYIAKCLLQDPCDPFTSAYVERVIGNVGKSGMAMLVSPKVPRVRDVSHQYSLVNHDPFDGTENSCFRHTTLHMSFTEWQLPIDVGSRGTRDIEAYYVEAAIGVYDYGKWVADVNINDIFRHQMSRILPECIIRHEREVPRQGLSKFVAIDSWEELLDCPPEVGVVRARGNWQARLAAAALSVQRGHETRVLPGKVCWTCCVALPPVPRTETRDEDHQLGGEEDVIGVPSDISDEEASDSEVDEVFERSLALEKGKGKGRVEGCEDMRDELTAPITNRNIVYIF